MRQVTKNKIWTTSIKNQNQSEVHQRYQCLRWQLGLSRYITFIHQLCSILPWISWVAQTLHNSRDNHLETSRWKRWLGQRAFLCFKSVPGNGTWESYCIFLELLTGLYMTVGLIDSAIKAYPYMDLWLLWDILSEKVWLSGSDLLQMGLSFQVYTVWSWFKGLVI